MPLSFKVSSLDALPGLGCLPKQELKMLIKTLLLLLGVKPDNYPNKLEAEVLGEFVNRALKNYSPQEIRFAFELAVAGNLRVEVYQKLDSVLIGRVIKAYEEYKRERSKKEKIAQSSSNRQERFEEVKTDAERLKIERVFIKKVVLPLWNNFNPTDEWVPESGYWCVYDLLDAKGLVDLDDSVKNEFLAKAELFAAKKQKRGGLDRKLLWLGIYSMNDCAIKAIDVNVAKGFALKQVFFEIKIAEVNLEEALKS